MWQYRVKIKKKKCFLHLTGAEDLPALWPADGSLGEEGGADGEQPQAQGQGEQDARVLREAVPRDPEAAGAAGALPEVTCWKCRHWFIKCSRTAFVLFSCFMLFNFPFTVLMWPFGRTTVPVYSCTNPPVQCARASRCIPEPQFPQLLLISISFFHSHMIQWLCFNHTLIWLGIISTHLSVSFCHYLIFLQ